MAHEFKIKSGLQVMNTHAITGISNEPSIFSIYDNSTLVTANAIRRYIEDSSKSLTTTSIQFDLNNTTSPVEGQLVWNDNDGTLDLGMPGGNVVLQIGQEMLVRVSNHTGADMYNGNIVYNIGSQGNRPTVGLASAFKDANITQTAMLTEDIPDNGSGYATLTGIVRDLNTSQWPEGTALYLSVTPGALTSTKPSAPDNIIWIGVVLKSHTTTGSIYFKPTVPMHLTDLSDVNGTPLSQTGQIMVWHNDTSVFDFDYNINNYTLKTYVDSSLSIRDASITALKLKDTQIDASITALKLKDTQIDASLSLRPLTTYVDGSLNLKLNLSGGRLTGDTSISTNLYVDGSLFIKGNSLISGHGIYQNNVLQATQNNLNFITNGTPILIQDSVNKEIEIKISLSSLIGVDPCIYANPGILSMNSSGIVTSVSETPFDLIQYSPEAELNTNTVLSTYVPAGYAIDYIAILEYNDASAGYISLGTSAYTDEVISNFFVKNSADVIAPVGQQYFSRANDTTLYISSTNWGSGKIQLNFKLDKII